MTTLLQTVPEMYSTAYSDAGQLRIDLELSERSIHHARAMVGSNVRLWGLDELASDISLTVSELLTNVLRHAVAPYAGGQCTKVARCLIQRFPAAVVVVVHDDDPTLPTDRDVQHDSTTGRGLLLVRGIADDVVITPSGPGKDVTAIFRLSASLTGKVA
jgi:anti-sigma regulatory factor (Ser/Thr protein kinase)